MFDPAELVCDFMPSQSAWLDFYISLAIYLVKVRQGVSRRRQESIGQCNNFAFTVLPDRGLPA